MFTRTLIVILYVGCFGVASRADEAPKYKPIDRETVAAYEKLGARYGGFEVRAFGRITFWPGKKSAAKWLPGFAIVPAKDGTLPKLPPVQVPFGLDLYSTEVTDTGLNELKGLKNLTLLQFAGNVKDAGLKEVKELKYLTVLDLRSANVTDEGLKEISELKKLAILCLYNTKVTHAGLKELRGLKNLAVLSLDDTKVTDAGLKELKDLKSLISIGLDGTLVTDAGLKDLKELKNLTELNLHYTQVTDMGLKELKNLKELIKLDLLGTNVTPEGVKELKRTLPGCKVRHFAVPSTAIGLAVFISDADQSYHVAIDNSEVVVNTSTIDLVVRKGIDCIPTLLTILKDDGISFDLFVRCYSCCDQILKKIDPEFVIAWQGGAGTMDNEHGQMLRFLPSYPSQDEQEYRTRVINDIEKKYAMALKKKGKR